MKLIEFSIDLQSPTATFLSLEKQNETYDEEFGR